MTPTEAAWLAGFMDGEGSILSYPVKNGKTDKVYTGWKLSVANTSLESLEYCKEIVGAGTIVSKSVVGNRRPQWIYYVNKRQDMIDIIDQIFPYLLIKHEQSLSFLKAHSDLILARVA